MTIMLNIFEVKPDDEEAFMDAWDYTLAYFSKAPGFIRVTLHRETRRQRRLQEEGEYYHDQESENSASKEKLIRFFNYVEYESPEAFENAVRGEGYIDAVAPLSKVSTRNPQLFEILRTHPSEI